MEKIILIGGGGHCRVVIDLIRLIGKYEIVGICDTKKGINLDVPVIGSDEILPEIFLSGVRNAFVCFGAIGCAKKRKIIGDKLLEYGFYLPNLIHPRANISNNVQIGIGNFIGVNAIINTNSKILNGCIINSAAVIEHDVQLGDYVHMAPGSLVCGEVEMDDLVHIGPNATVLERCHIVTGVVVGAGSVVTRSITVPNITGYGNPFREVRVNV